MGKHLVLILLIQLSSIYLTTRGIPVGAGDHDHLVLLKESHVDVDVDDDGRGHGDYVQVASVVEEQKPVGYAHAHQPNSLPRAELVVEVAALPVLRDEDEEEEVQGPGYQGILAGLTGIFSNVVNGNLGKLVESTFNFVPPVHQGNVQGVYNSLLGKPPLTTSTEPAAEPEAAEVATTAASVSASAAAVKVTAPARVAGVTAGGAGASSGAVTQKTALQAAIVASAGADEDEDQDQDQDAEIRRKRKHVRTPRLRVL